MGIAELQAIALMVLISFIIPLIIALIAVYFVVRKAVRDELKNGR